MKTQIQKAQKGFTLIELMVVVAITGILAAIAIPAYQDYSVRAKITDALSQAGAAKSGIADYYQAKNTFASSNDEAGLGATASYATEVVSTLGVSGSGVITVAIKSAISSQITASTNKLMFTPTTTTAGGIKWVCAPAGTEPLKQKFLPGSCRS